MINRFKRAIQYNFLPKMLALLASVILWVIVMNEQNPVIEREYNLPLNYVGVPQGYKLTRDADSVRVKVRGKRSVILDTDTNQFHANLVLSGLESGTHPVPVTLQLPSGVEAVEFSPGIANVTFDPFMEKQVRVEIIPTGTPERGRSLNNIFQENVVVTVAGPSSTANNVTRVVGYVSIDGQKDDFSLNVPLVPIGEDGKEVKDVRVFPSSTDIEVDLVQRLGHKFVGVEAILDKNLPVNYIVESVSVTPRNVEIAGEEEVIEKINVINTESLSLIDAKETFTRQARVLLPPGVMVSEQEVTVTVNIKPKSPQKK